MRWRGRRQSANIEDRRDFGRAGGGRTPFGRGLGGLGGLGGLAGGLGRRRGGMRPRIGRKGGLGGLGLIAVVIIVALLGGDPTALLTGGGSGFTTPQREAVQPIDPATDPQGEMKRFIAVVLADTEETWTRIFAAQGRRYEAPTLVLFDDDVRSACGPASAAMGPFYCSVDRRVYLDMTFFRALDQRFGAPGDFAQAYVIAHEVGHHVQQLLGVLTEAQRVRRQVSEVEANAVTVRLELQADCYAGVWGHHADRARGLLERGDLEEALAAAAAVGDDTIQRNATGTVRPETFTHGTSEQRARWFRTGFRTGDPGACDTFSAASL